MSRQNKQVKLALVAKAVRDMHAPSQDKQGLITMVGHRGPGRGKEITRRSGSRAGGADRKAACALVMAKIRVAMQGQCEVAR